VTDVDCSDSISFAPFQRTPNGGGVFTIKDSPLDGTSDFCDFQKEVVVECDVVGIEGDVDVHYG